MIFDHTDCLVLNLEHLGPGLLSADERRGGVGQLVRPGGLDARQRNFVVHMGDQIGSLVWRVAWRVWIGDVLLQVG